MDWIANVVGMNLLNSNAKWKFLFNMDKIYYTGTESIKNENLKMILDDETVVGINDYDELFIKWDTNTTSFSENIVSRIINIRNLTIEALKSEKYMLASYYFGVIVSYVSLVFYYPIYEYDNDSFSNLSSTFDSMISKHTVHNLNFNSNDNFKYNLTHPEITKLSLIQSYSYNITYNTLYNATWIRDNLSEINDNVKLTELSNYNEATQIFYSHHEEILNLCMQYTSNLLYTIFAESGAKGGDIKIPSMFTRLSKEWQYGIIGICLGLFIVIVYTVYLKATGKNIELGFWKKRKVIIS
jgi:hypothetical protein